MSWPRLRVYLNQIFWVNPSLVPTIYKTASLYERNHMWTHDQLIARGQRKGRHLRGGAAASRPIWSSPIRAEHLGVEPIVETIGSHGHVVIHGEEMRFPDQII